MTTIIPKVIGTVINAKDQNISLSGITKPNDESGCGGVLLGLRWGKILSEFGKLVVLKKRFFKTIIVMRINFFS